MPDHPDAPVTRLPPGRLVRSHPWPRHAFGSAPQLGGPQRLAHRHLHRVELVVACHLLRELAATSVLEDDEVAHEVEEALGSEDALAHHLQPGRWIGRRSPETVRQGLNHSRPAVSVPTRASTPSEMTSNAFVAKSNGTSAL